jgi:hypothetical protein
LKAKDLVSPAGFSQLRERIRQDSEDITFTRACLEIFTLLKEHHVEYLVIGSCAVQTYLCCPRRLPNDLDFVIGPEDETRFVELCLRHGIELRRPLGRMVGSHHAISFHTLVGSMKLLNAAKSRIIADVPLRPTDFREERDLTLLLSPHKLTLPVPSLEVLLVLDLMRPLNTNTVVEVDGILSECRLDYAIIQRFVDRAPIIKPILRVRLVEFGDLDRCTSPEARNVANEIIRNVNLTPPHVRVTRSAAVTDTNPVRTHVSRRPAQRSNRGKKKAR